MDRRNLAIDIAALAVYLVAANPAVTGIGIHEWLGLGMLVIFFVHAAMHVDWVIEAVRRSFVRLSWARTGNAVLDLVIVAVVMVVMVSGVMVSGAVLPALGLYADGYYSGIRCTRSRRRRCSRFFSCIWPCMRARCTIC